ncbi:cytochrome-c oxidase [Massilia sp. KIM]|uniref:cytochrome-c oxidase n=1 Tax=Massilia sp. KIM TaxID=1955422 RepID=UPI00098F7F39|nr:cytochrome-c oxidase [Massilia sp. KIM]OON60641.1 cytochrome-c oxidase [Massilia sp. KIM]
MQTTTQGAAAPLSGAGIVWLKLSVLYLILGVAIGMAMGASHNFTLRPVHTHVNLLGWTTLALAGLIYSVFPQAGASRLAKAHFWLLNLALPVMLIGLTLLVTGNTAMGPVLAVAESVAALGVLAFAANLFLNLKR